MSKIKQLRLTKAMSKLVMIAVACLVLLTSPGIEAARYNDGWHWTNCSGRYTVATRSWGNAKMIVYGCSNGYYFTHVTSKSYNSKNALIERKSPLASSLKAGTAYAVTSNMVARLKGSCYRARGYADGASREVHFCYR